MILDILPLPLHGIVLRMNFFYQQIDFQETRYPYVYEYEVQFRVIYFFITSY